MTSSPPLCVSLGDPCGIGPEIIAAAWRAVRSNASLAFCVIGDAATLEAPSVPVRRVGQARGTEAVFADALPVMDRPLSHPAIPGRPDAVHAPHIIDWIEHGVALCLSGDARALVTAPIAKSVL